MLLTPLQILIALMLYGLLLSGCTFNHQGVSFQSEGITQTFTDGKSGLPRSFPLPIYPNSSVTGSISASGDQENGNFLMLDSNSTCDQVTAFYQQQLPLTGWKLENTQASPKLINITASKDSLEGNIMISTYDHKTSISLSVNKQESAEAQKYTPGKSYPIDKLNPPTD